MVMLRKHGNGSKSLAWSMIVIAAVYVANQLVEQNGMTFEQNYNEDSSGRLLSAEADKNEGTVDSSTITSTSGNKNEGLFKTSIPSMSFKFMGNCQKSMRSIVNYYDDGLETHPNRIPNKDVGDDDDQNQFVIFCGRFKFQVGATQLLNLPPRSPSNPYIVWSSAIQLDECSRDFNSNCQAWAKVASRNDILHAAMDHSRRLCDDSERYHLPGVNLAPATPATTGVDMIVKIPTPPEDENFLARKYLIFFAGMNHRGYWGSSMVRPWLFRSYNAWKKDTAKNNEKGGDDVLITTHMNTKEEYISTLLNSKFALVPHGDGRWNYRLYDVIQAGSIPVFLADGYDLPFSPYIHWENASVTMKEDTALNFDALQQQLRSIPSERVSEMAKNVRRINEECFATPQQRADCFVKSVSILVQEQTYTEAPVEFGERLQMPLCPLGPPARKNDDRGRVEYESLESWEKYY